MDSCLFRVRHRQYQCVCQWLANWKHSRGFMAKHGFNIQHHCPDHRLCLCKYIFRQLGRASNLQHKYAGIRCESPLQLESVPAGMRHVRCQFVLPWRKSKLHSAMPQFDILCHRIKLCRPVRMPSCLVVAAQTQLHLQQRHIPSRQFRPPACWLAVQHVRKRQLLPAWQQHRMPCGLLLPILRLCSCAMPTWIVLSGLIICSSHLRPRQLLHQWILQRVPRTLLLPIGGLSSDTMSRWSVLLGTICSAFVLPHRQFLRQRHSGDLPCRLLLSCKRSQSYSLSCRTALRRPVDRSSSMPHRQLLPEWNRHIVPFHILLSGQCVQPHRLPSWIVLPELVGRSHLMLRRLFLPKRHLQPMPRPVLLPGRHGQCHRLSERHGMPTAVIKPWILRLWVVLPERDLHPLSSGLILRCWCFGSHTVPPGLVLRRIRLGRHPVPGQQQHARNGGHLRKPVHLQPGLHRHGKLQRVFGQLLLSRRCPGGALSRRHVFGSGLLQLVAMRLSIELVAHRIHLHLQRGPASGHQRRRPAGRLGVRRVPRQQRVRQWNLLPMCGGLLLRGGQCQSVSCQHVLRGGKHRGHQLSDIFDLPRRILRMHMRQRLHHEGLPELRSATNQHLRSVPCQHVLHGRQHVQLPRRINIAPRIAEPGVMRVPARVLLVPGSLCGVPRGLFLPRWLCHVQHSHQRVSCWVILPSELISPHPMHFTAWVILSCELIRHWRVSRWVFLHHTHRPSHCVPHRNLLRAELNDPNNMPCQHLLLVHPADVHLQLYTLHHLHFGIVRNLALPELGRSRMPRLHRRATARVVPDVFDHLPVDLQRRIRRADVQPVCCRLVVRAGCLQPVPAQQRFAARRVVAGQLHLQPRLHHRNGRHKPLRALLCRRDMSRRGHSGGDRQPGAAAQRLCAIGAHRETAPACKQSGVAVPGNTKLCGHHPVDAAHQHHRLHAPSLPQRLLRLLRRIAHLRAESVGWRKPERAGPVRLQRHFGPCRCAHHVCGRHSGFVHSYHQPAIRICDWPLGGGIVHQQRYLHSLGVHFKPPCRNDAPCHWDHPCARAAFVGKQPSSSANQQRRCGRDCRGNSDSLATCAGSGGKGQSHDQGLLASPRTDINTTIFVHQRLLQHVLFRGLRTHRPFVPCQLHFAAGRDQHLPVRLSAWI